MDPTLEGSSELEAKASSLLTWTFTGTSLLAAIEIAETAQKQNPVRPLCITLCGIVYVLCNLLTVALYIWATAVPCIPGYNAARYGAAAVAVGWITISVVWQRWRGFCASNLPPFIHGCCFVAAFADLLLWKEKLVSYRITTHDCQNDDTMETILRAVLTCAALGSFLCACFRSSPVLHTATSEVNTAANEETFSPWARMVGFAAITHILNAERSLKVLRDDIRPIIRRLKCRLLVNRLDTSLKRNWGNLFCCSFRRSAGVRVTCAFVRVLWCEVLWLLLMGFAYYATMMVRVPLLEALIEDITREDVRAVIMLFVMACAAEVCLTGFLEYLARRLAVELKCLMYGALFSKMTRMSTSALSQASAGYLVSVLAVDVEKLSIAFVLIGRDTLGVLSLPIILWMLANRVGAWPVAGCVAWLLVSIIIYVVASKLQAYLWKSINSCRDDRLRKMADILSHVRLLKLYAWEEAAMESVKRYRKQEGWFIFLNNICDGFLDSLQNSSSSVVSIR